MENGTIIYNKKTQKAAKVYRDSGDQLLIVYLKDGKRFGPFRRVKTINFSTNKGEGETKC